MRRREFHEEGGEKKAGSSMAEPAKYDIPREVGEGFRNRAPEFSLSLSYQPSEDG